MERDLGKEIDALKEQMEELMKIMARQGNGKKPTSPEDRVEVMDHMHPDPHLKELMSRLCEETNRKKYTGMVTYMGVFASGGHQQNWIRSQVDTDRLLALIEDETAAQVLSCIGSQERLNILLALLRKPSGVGELIEKCGFHSTGQVYHHLRPLLASHLIEEKSRGVYRIPGQKIQGIIMLLAGICDVVDKEYTAN